MFILFYYLMQNIYLYHIVWIKYEFCEIANKVSFKYFSLSLFSGKMKYDDVIIDVHVIFYHITCLMTG